MNIITKIEKKSEGKKNLEKNSINRINDKFKYDKNRNRDRSRFNFKKEKNYFKNKIKTKTFVMNEFSKNNSDLKDYHQFENLTYYDSNSDKKNHDEFDATVNLAIIADVVCRQCKTFFRSIMLFINILNSVFKKSTAMFISIQTSMSKYSQIYQSRLFIASKSMRIKTSKQNTILKNDNMHRRR